MTITTLFEDLGNGCHQSGRNGQSNGFGSYSQIRILLLGQNFNLKHCLHKHIIFSQEQIIQHYLSFIIKKELSLTLYLSMKPVLNCVQQKILLKRERERVEKDIFLSLSSIFNLGDQFSFCRQFITNSLSLFLILFFLSLFLSLSLSPLSVSRLFRL